LGSINAIGIHTRNAESLNNVYYAFDVSINFASILVFLAFATVIAGGL
jgi:hypothetical protein